MTDKNELPLERLALEWQAAQEAASLHMDDLDLKAGTVRVFGKGAKERLCLIGAQTQESLIRWFHFRPEPTIRGQVFLNLDGSPMTPNGVKLVFKRMAKTSGVTRLHAHLLRHTFANQFIENDGDAFTLQALMGDSTPEMSRRYCTVNTTRAEIKRLSPVDNLGLRPLSRLTAVTTCGSKASCSDSVVASWAGNIPHL